MEPSELYPIARRAWDRGLSRHTAWRYVEKDDAVQVAVLRCWQYRDRHDPIRGLPADAFFAFVSKNEFNSYSRSRKHRRIGRPLRAHHLLTEPDAVVVNAATREELAELAQIIREILTPEAARMLMMLYSGTTLREVGAELGITRQAIHQRRDAAMAKLRTAIWTSRR